LPILSSPASSPERNCRANSLFSPTYELVIRAILRSARRIPRPQSSTPQLLGAPFGSLAPRSGRAAISFIGLPDRPKPPTAREAPSGMSATASAGLGTTLSIPGPLLPEPRTGVTVPPVRARSGFVRGNGPDMPRYHCTHVLTARLRSSRQPGGEQDR